MLIGSKAFSSLWKEWQKEYQPLQVLKLLLAYIEMPEDLSGELEELSGYYPTLTLTWRLMMSSGRILSAW